MPELKPCPFCGGEAEMRYVSDIFSPRRNIYWAQCCSCRMSGKHHRTRQKAIEAWNTRAYYEAELSALPMTEENMREYGWVRERTCRNVNEGHSFTCSECGDCTFNPFPEIMPLLKLNYCPNCGAKVTEEDTDGRQRD